MQFNFKKTYLIIGVVLILSVGIAITLDRNGIERASKQTNSSNGTSNQQVFLPSVSVSEQAETIQFDGEKIKVFSRVILDPFLVEQGEPQQVVVVPNFNIRNMKVELTDGGGTQKKTMKLGKLNGEQVYYFNWKPNQLVSKQKYPITFISVTQDGMEHSLSLSWQAQ